LIGVLNTMGSFYTMFSHYFYCILTIRNLTSQIFNLSLEE
jgi:hypothetical protein